MFPDIGAITGKIERSFSDNLSVLRAICGGILRVSRVLEQEYGTPGMNPAETRLRARSLSRVPVFVEDVVTQAVKQTTINLEQANRNLVPSRGFYSNLGDDPFQVVLMGLEGDTTIPHTVPAGVTIAITSYVTSITVIWVSGTAKYQIAVQ